VLLGGVEYFDLLEEARNRYGPVDDVVSVSLDKKTLGLVPIFAVTNFTLRGIAIRYVKEAPVAAE
jgi:hypothetical protein